MKGERRPASKRNTIGSLVQWPQHLQLLVGLVALCTHSPSVAALK